MREARQAPRWVRRGQDAVPDEVLARYRDGDERRHSDEDGDRVVTAVQWHPVAAGVLLGFLLAFPLIPLAIGLGTTWGAVGVLVVCALLVLVGAWLVRSNLRRTLLPAIRALRPDIEVPSGLEPHLSYLASWSSRRDAEVRP